mgnify:CR=1 FL=1
MSSTGTVNPPTYPLLVPQRASLLEFVTLPIDGVGVEFYAMVYASERRSRKLFDLTIEVQDTTPEAVLAISGDWETTRLMTRDGWWDLLAVYPDGTRDHWLKGPAVIDLRVTEETP